MNRATFSALLAAVLAACSHATTGPDAPTPRPGTTGSANVVVSRARWDSFHFRDYSYVYLQTGFFITFTGHQVRVVVKADSVTAVRDAVTGDSVPWSPQTFPTIDQLFDRAIAADSAGLLSGIAYDSVYGYPTRIDFAGPPDASGSVFVSAFTPPGAGGSVR